MRLSPVLLCALLAVQLASVSPARAAPERLPRFQDLPAGARYTGPRAAVQLSTPQARLFRTRLREATRQPANFAGEQVLAVWGCGTICVEGAAVNLRTGRVVFLPGSICCWMGREERLELRVDSRLLVTRGVIGETGQYGLHYHEFTGTTFRHLRTVPVAQPGF